ncbi:MAG: reductive dehalogenase domain-containing protein [Polyangia bacterium]
MSPRPLSNPGPLTQFDERDTVFSRARLRPGSDVYDSYYRGRRDLKQSDDRTRRLAPLASPETRRYRASPSALVESQFAASDLVAEAVEREERGEAPGLPSGLGAAPAETAAAERRLADGSPEGLTRFAREAAAFLGADDAGVARLDRSFVYSHRGRPLERFGEPIGLEHRYAVVLVFEMRQPYLQASPEMIGTAETARVYQRAAAACFALAGTLRRLGYDARAHVDSNYLVICPALAVEAGLGELGRNGILVHRRLGPGVRLGAVTVDAELIPDGPRCWGIADFCRICGKCAENCPAGAIPEGDPQVVRGALKWPLAAERCYHYWRTQGTDCGVCVRTCPFAKPDSALHRAVRWLVAGTSAFDRLLLWADDLVYGASPQARLPPHLE